MRRVLLSSVILLVSVCSLAFAGNNQKIYSVDSEVYRNISNIYVATGHALPSSTGPWSGDELSKMIEAIDSKDVPDYLQASYIEVLRTLGKKADTNFKGGAFDFNGTLALEMYLHTYNVQSDKAISRTDINGLEEHAFEGRSWWFAKDLNHITPFFDFEIENYLTDHVYFVFNLPLQNAVHGREYGELGSTRLNTNIIMLQNLKFDFGIMDIATFPHKAFAAVGGNGWSLQVGRDRLSWGAGSTGNVTLSDNFPYHDMIRVTAYGEKLKYTYLLSFFPNKMNYYKDGTYEGTGDVNSTNKMDGLFFYTAHRFEFRLFKDKVGLTLTEGLVYASETNNIQIQALSPIYFMHNAFMPKNSNSTLALELNVTPVKGLTVYGELLLDQTKMPFIESGKYGEEPSAYAVLLGAKYISGIKEGILTINPEVAYVSPFCYLREFDGSGNYGLDYVGAIKSRLYAYEDRGPDVLYEDYVIGYTYGPDCLVASIDASWEGEKLSLSANTMFMIHGTHDLWTKWSKTPSEDQEEVYNEQFTGLSSSHSYNGNYRYSDAQSRNALWYTVNLGAGASYQVTESLKASVDVDLVLMKNVYNVASPTVADFQIVLGGTYSCF